MKDEAKFFSNHDAYRSITHKQGTAYLTSSLNKVLINHIKSTLPQLKQRVSTMLMETQAELRTYGEGALDGKSRGATLLQLLQQFAADFKNMVDGRASEISTEELYGGARIQYIFNDLFAQGLEKIDPIDGLTEYDIRTAIRNATGPRPTLFVPEVAFELLAKRQISGLEAPSLQVLRQFCNKK